MINDVLQFVSKSALEVMLAEQVNEITIRIIPDTHHNSINLRIGKHAFARKIGNVANFLNKQGLDYLLDTPLNLKVSVPINFDLGEYQELKRTGSQLNFTITGADNFGEKFLKAFSKDNSVVSISAGALPQFENPRI